MDKFVYCHEGNAYEDFTSLKDSNEKIFKTLREVISNGTFIYAPTTAGKAVLLSYSQANGNSRVDGYKGEYGEINPNPATYIGNLRVDKPYTEKVIGALPVSNVFENGRIDAEHMVRLVQYVVFGNSEKDIVLLGNDITLRTADYLKFLYLLFPPQYARKVGFCINKYIKYALEDERKFSKTDEKPVIRIYALSIKDSFSESYRIDLDADEGEAEVGDRIAVKALKELIGRGITKENFDAIFRATEEAFTADGGINIEKYVRCLVRAAYQNSYDLAYADALLSYEFSNDREKRLFVDCIRRMLETDDENRMKIASKKAIACLKDDLGVVQEPLFSYIISKNSMEPEERKFLVQSTVKQLKEDDIDGDELLNRYLNAPLPSWKQKYEFITEIINCLVIDGKNSQANKVCRILSERFNKEKLAYANDISLEDLFTLKANICKDAQNAIYASLLKNDCGNKIRSHARLYLKKKPIFSDILLVRNKMQDIFNERDFIFGDSECEQSVRVRIEEFSLEKLLEIYDSLSAKLTDYAQLKAEFFSAICNIQKLKASDASILGTYKRFLSDVESDLPAVGSAIEPEKEQAIDKRLQQCKAYISENESERSAQEKIKKFCNDFSQNLYDMLSDSDKNQLDSASDKKGAKKENSGSAPSEKYNKVLRKYSLANNVGLNYNGLRPYKYDALLCVLAGLIACLIMVIPAVCLMFVVGDFTFITFKTYLSRYFYAALCAPLLTVLLYCILLTVFKRNERSSGGVTAFGITALCSFIPCLLCGAGYVLAYVFLT